MNETLNEYVIERVNDITPNDYDITTSFLPRHDEPRGINSISSVSGINNDFSMNYTDL